ncbi:flagellar basal body rod protein FlgC [Celerinatantimonas yamalensis]|uniref:Flagellar basal-body rod protein FlgC n=1 Tax=Celerinatantimonas yamalensis TaxID=559956 RepID=A0ABW9G5W2_9GAMM
MGLFNVFDVSASGLKAQSIRLNTTASNLANADSVSSNFNDTYRARKPVFAAALDQAMGSQNPSAVKVEVRGIVESNAPLRREYAPNNPMADKDGYVYKPNVNVMEEMADMISASRSYQTNVQVADAAKQMLNSTLNLGKG